MKRTSPTHGSRSAHTASVKWIPIAAALSTRPSSSSVSIIARPAADAIALPPDVGVVPPKNLATTALPAQVIASEPTPPDSPLPPVTISGSRP